VLNAEELQEFQKNLNPKEMPTSKKQLATLTLEFKADEETKQVTLDNADPSKTATIGTGLSSK